MARSAIPNEVSSVAAGLGRSSSVSPTRWRSDRARSSATSSPPASSGSRGSRCEMDFTLTDEQVMLRDTAHALLTRHCPMSLVRAHVDDPAVADVLWEHLCEWVVLGDGPLTDLCLFL